jgi:hypothetical protein
MQRYNFRLTLIVAAILAIIIGTSNITGAAARVTNLTESYVKQLITSAINAMVPSMIEDAIDTQVPGMIDTLIDSKVPGMIETRLNELSAPTGGDPVNPVVNPVIVQNPLAGALNVRDYGAKGDGVANDTAAINAAINAANAKGGGTVYVPSGNYSVAIIDDNYDNAIILKSNVKLMMDTNARLVMQPQTGATRLTNYAVVGIRGDNTEICGGEVVGELDYQYYQNSRTAEWGHTLRVYGRKNVKIHDMKFSDAWGDNIAIGGTGTTNATYSENVEVWGCVCDGAYRDNLTIYQALNCYVHDMTFIDGLQCFVDVEPNNLDALCYNVLVENCSGTHCERYYAYTYGFGAIYNLMAAGGTPTFASYGTPWKVTFKGCTGMDLNARGLHNDPDVYNNQSAYYDMTWIS